MTEDFVQSVKPHERRIKYWDTKEDHLVLCVHPTGRKVWQLYYRRDRTRWYTIGVGIDLETARKAAAKLKAEMTLDPNLDIQAEKMQERKAGTFAELADHYLQAKTILKSWDQSDAKVRRYLLPHWKNRRANEIRREDMLALFNKLTNRGYPIAANQAVIQASAIFRWAISQGVGNVTTNPCYGVEYNKTASRDRVLSSDEVPMFWHAFDDAGLIASNALKMILLTGQRPGEVSHMRWQDIDDGWWTLPGEPDGDWPGTKNSHTHQVWLSEPARAILGELDDENVNLVFANSRGTPVSGLAPAMRQICTELEVKKKATPHDLRRTHGTTITGLGFGRDHMNRIQNHVEGGIADVYDQYGYRDEMRRVQEAVAAKLMALVEGRPMEDNVVKLA